VVIEHQELLPQLLANVAAVLRGQIITTEGISAVPTGIEPMNEPILHQVIPIVEILMM
jgi:hypothetical protein